MARKEKKYHYIYKTTNVLSGKYYIGMHSTDNLDDGYLGSGTRLRYSIRKYGEENHVREVLEYCESREELKSREAEIVNLNEIAKVDCMNLVIGGQGGFISLSGCTKGGSITGKLHADRLKNDEEYRRKFSIKASEIAKNNYKLGLFKRVDWTGKKHSEESKQKMSESKKGKYDGVNNPSFGTCWITNDVESKKIYKGDLIPEGWRLGRVMKKK